MTTGRCSHHRLGTNHARRADTVFDHDILARDSRQVLRIEAPNDIGRATRWKRYHQGQGPVRKAGYACALRQHLAACACDR